MDVTGKDGKVVNWGIEGGTPSNLFRNGITKGSLPVGTEIKLFGYQAKSGEPRGVGVFVEYLDGRKGFHGRVCAWGQRCWSGGGGNERGLGRRRQSRRMLLAFFDWLATTAGSIALSRVPARVSDSSPLSTS
jgi:hypothetical protein